MKSYRLVAFFLQSEPDGPGTFFTGAHHGHGNCPLSVDDGIYYGAPDHSVEGIGRPFKHVPDRVGEAEDLDHRVE